MADVLTMVLAGGTGSRLMPLTAARAKPAVPFGGRYRIIDFVLSNCVNSGLLKIKVLTQYKSESLTRHLQRGWQLSSVVDHFVDAVPAQQRTGGNWYLGSADAVYQNLNLVRDVEPEHLAIFGGDHVYRMDIRQMLDVHEDSGADATVAAIPVRTEEAAGRFGVIATDDAGWMVGFAEKPASPEEIAGRPGWCLCSMGNYVFRTEVAVAEVERDAVRDDSSHDFGKDVLTSLFGRARVRVYDFSTNRVPAMTDRERGYWRDVGSIESYYDASMDLIAVDPVFNLYNRRWPIRSFSAALPPAKFVFDGEDRSGWAVDSLVSEGCIISGANIRRSVLGPGIRVHSWAEVDDCILMGDVEVGRHARLRRAILDKDVVVPPGAEIGYDEEVDRRRFHVSENGIVVVAKGVRIDAP